MSKLNVFLKGRLVTETPLSVVTPNAEEMKTPDGGKYKQIVRRAVYRDGVRVILPVLPASTLRGRLRRSCVEIFRILDGGKPMQLDTWHRNAVGGVKGDGKEDAFDVIMRSEWRKQNPVLGLFGAGDPWMLGHAQIEDGIPEPVEAAQGYGYEDRKLVNIVGGIRTDDARRDGDFFAKLTEESVDAWKGKVDANAQRTKLKAEKTKLSAALRKAKKAKDDAAVEALEAELEAVEKSAEELKLTKENPVSMPIQHEAMASGVPMLQDIRLNGVTPEEAGLFLAAMNQTWKSTPAFGGHANLGYGMVSAVYDVFVEEVDQIDPFAVGTDAAVPVGTIELKPYGGMTKAPEAVKSLMADFKKAYEDGKFDILNKPQPKKAPAKKAAEASQEAA